MNLAEYQSRARSTAAPVAFTYGYLANGAFSEAGELAGRTAKALWKGDLGTPEYQRDIALEYGDICWMAAIMLHKQGIHGRDGWGHPFTHSDLAHLGLSPIGVVVAEATELFQQYHSEENVFYLDARPLWDALETHCATITGYPLSQVLQMNLDKLASRAARGTLIGNGDHR